MSKKLLSAAVTGAMTVLFLANCSSSGPEEAPAISEWSVTEEFTAVPDPSIWHTADGWTNGGMFNCGWKSGNVSYSDGKMIITMNDTPSSGKPYSSGELRTNETYGYGYYEVKMKPCNASGTNSSFFLYTNVTTWDEIDIEFLGKDMTKVQFNYYVDGEGGHEELYSLGFDASKSFHTYAIEYKPKEINWYVDGKKVHTAKNGKLPSHKMQVMANFWPGTGTDWWLGEFTYTKPLQAEYEYIRFVEY